MEFWCVTCDDLPVAICHRRHNVVTDDGFDIYVYGE